MVKIALLDRSPMSRQILSRNLYRETGLRLVIATGDPRYFMQRLSVEAIDYILINLDNLAIDACLFIKRIKPLSDAAILGLSALADAANEVPLRALRAGATDIVPLPGGGFTISDCIGYVTRRFLPGPTEAPERRQNPRPSPEIRPQSRPALLVIGAEHCELRVVSQLVRGLKPVFPPAVALIKMPRPLLTSFSRTLGEITQTRVQLVDRAVKLYPSTVYLCSGHQEICFALAGQRLFLYEKPAAKSYRPERAIDQLFETAAKVSGRACAGILVGKGDPDDGEGGLRALRATGARAFRLSATPGAQREEGRRGKESITNILQDVWRGQ
jgi:chemotaxis response regulator CheB